MLVYQKVYQFFGKSDLIHYLCSVDLKFTHMKVILSLSTKKDASGFAQVLLWGRKKVNGIQIGMRAKSGCYVKPEKFDEANNKVDEYKSTKLKTEDVRRHNDEVGKLKWLLAHIDDKEKETDTFDSAWLADVVDRYNNPNKYLATGKDKDIYTLFAEYLDKKQFSIDFHKGNLVMIRSFYRWVAYKNATQRAQFCIGIDSLNKEDIEDYKDYLSNEQALSEEHPHLFARIMANYPDCIGKGRNTIEARGSNAVFKLMKKLKQFFTYLNSEDITTNNPFEGLNIGSEKFGTPFYITTEERDIIASTPMPTQHLSTQRDIFIFHCFIGCRVSDLIKLTADNIADGVLTYTPHKTQDEGTQALQARIPLHGKAKELITQYKGKDSRGRLFPFISNQKYNDAIKEIFRIAGITRAVEVRNALTGEIEQRPINEVASSHLARRTFCGNLYFKVQDPNLIGKMSGHTEGSKAFARYRKIEDETLRNAIDLL